MLHPATELRFVSPQIGFGVFATAHIPKGTITWVHCKLDRRLTVDEVSAMGSVYQTLLDKYAYIDGAGKHVLCWDHARFVNHSCEPACVSPGFDCDVAVRDIAPGEELTSDYGVLNLTEGFACACDRPACRGTCGPGDGVALAEHWDALVAGAFEYAAKVDQPLLPLMHEREQVARALRGECPVPTIRCHLLYGKERPVGARVELVAGTFRLVANQPLEPGQVLLRCEGPATSEGSLPEDERARAVFVRGRGLVVPHNEVRFIGRSARPNTVLEDEGTVRVTRAIAPGEEITLPDAKA
ncbi:MAG TPA: SET domain-containing protein-lysine N-methyltransferase [Labilithrix sp.]|nr:SET domain-containing protein-lysine N-methyltransferase [Labilithrix sp.]